ncbi:flotillin domain-containing protein, partial [Candidatus Marithioploca araucensis]|nr:flotillin domain-containing protein [Candidatus Marithioploca araucensis]
DARKITATAEAEAIKIRAEADEQHYKVEAEGKRQINEAANMLSDAQIEMQVKLNALEQLPTVIAESVKPMERIEGIKIYQVEGLNVGNSTNQGGNVANGNLAEQVTNAALRYRMQTPLVDNILKELGFNIDLGIKGMTDGMLSEATQEARQEVTQIAENEKTPIPDA